MIRTVLPHRRFEPPACSAVRVVVTATGAGMFESGFGRQPATLSGRRGTVDRPRGRVRQTGRRQGATPAMNVDLTRDIVTFPETAPEWPEAVTYLNRVGATSVTCQVPPRFVGYRLSPGGPPTFGGCGFPQVPPTFGGVRLPQAPTHVRGGPASPGRATHVRGVRLSPGPTTFRGVRLPPRRPPTFWGPGFPQAPVHVRGSGFSRTFGTSPGKDHQTSLAREVSEGLLADVAALFLRQARGPAEAGPTDRRSGLSLHGCPVLAPADGW